MVRTCCRGQRNAHAHPLALKCTSVASIPMIAPGMTGKATEVAVLGPVLCLTQYVRMASPAQGLSECWSFAGAAIMEG